MSGREPRTTINARKTRSEVGGRRAPEVQLVGNGERQTTANEPAPQLVNARAAARLLSISERKLWDMTKSGEVQHVRIGRLVRYRPRDLQAWIDANLQCGFAGSGPPDDRLTLAKPAAGKPASGPELLARSTRPTL